MTRDEELKARGEELGAALFTWYQYRSGTTCPDTADVRLYQVVGRTFMPYYPGPGALTRAVEDREAWKIQPGYGPDVAGWWLEHTTCGWRSNMQDGPRSMADLSRWMDNHQCKPAPEPNKPVGFVVRRPWSGIPAGWFVKAPNGTWYEIKATRRDGARQTVTILVDGREATFSYPVDTLVSCRRGTRVTEVSGAVDVLGEGAEILEDRT